MEEQIKEKLRKVSTTERLMYWYLRATKEGQTAKEIIDNSGACKSDVYEIRNAAREKDYKGLVETSDNKVYSRF